MAEKLCALRKKGGGGQKYTETSLWTNSSPTSNFAAQSVTLSDSMDNYKYLRVKYRMSTTDANEYSCIFLVDDIKHSSASTNIPQFSVVARTNTTYVRTFYYASGTSLQMNAAYVMNNTGSATNIAIPLEILGLNELAQGKSGGPMFEIMIGSGGSTIQYSGRVTTNDDSLVSIGTSTSQTGTVTIKRAAKGKIYFNYSARGTNTNRPSFTVKNVAYNPQAYDSQIQSGISVSFEANDTITYSSGKSASFDVGTLIFVEDA